MEQIGHVYEGLLERTVKRVPETTLGLIGSQKAVNPNVALGELEDGEDGGRRLSCSPTCWKRPVAPSRA